jgi:hypothetical protein
MIRINVPVQKSKYKNEGNKRKNTRTTETVEKNITSY